MAGRQTEAWSTTQRDVLPACRGTRLREDIAVSAGLKYWRYTRLELGIVELKAAELPKLALAYGISVSVLAEKLGLLTAQSRDWRAALMRLGASAEQAEAEVARTQSLTPEQREGWLLGRLSAMAQGRPLPPPRAKQPASQSRTG